MTSVLDDPDDVAAALRGTALAGHPVVEGTAGTMIVEGVSRSKALESWRAARSVLAVTGRWPVLTGPGEIYAGPNPDELDRASRDVDPWEIYRSWGEDEPVGRGDLHYYAGELAGVDLAAEAERQLSLPAPRRTVEWWVWKTILADPVLREEGHRKAADYFGTSCWTIPSAVQLVLLPTPKQYLAAGWVNYFGAARADGLAGLAAVIRQWDESWGAELVAAWSSELKFLVARRPEPGPRAWKLARQLKAVGGNLALEPWQLAFAVTRSDGWFVYDRP